jgi:hypothetical protein
MYGLLEAAEQIRDSGHFTKTIGNPAASLRGVRIVMTAELEQVSEEFWNSYFRMLARNRFNRVHVAFARIEAPYRLVQFLSRAAADYGIDFTLGIGGGVTAEELAHALIVCPAIRGVALEDTSAEAAVFSALRVAGRRVTLDLDGATAEPAVLQAALGEGLPLLRPGAAWPPSFEVAPPIDAANAEAHPVFYEVMGRLSYDPKSKSEYHAAREIGLWIAAAQQSNLGGSDYVAAVAGHGGSAKFTPAEIAERLDATAAPVGDTADGDLRLLAGLAREQAAQLRSAASFVAPVRRTSPAWTHMPPASAPSEQPLTLTLHIAQPKTVTAVRLHFRPTDPTAATQVIEQAAKAELSFTIPGREIAGNWDLQYFFEILNADGGGWFAPDPLTATPYWVVHVIAPHTGRN